MSDYINVKIDKTCALDVLIERLKVWTQDEDVISLYKKMYDDYLWNGCFDGGEFDVAQIVDNDWINYTAVINKGDNDFEKLLGVYKEQGIGDVSDKDFDYYKINYIEAVDDETDPSMFLVRL